MVSDTRGCLYNSRGDLRHIRTDTHLIPGRKVSYIEKVWEKDGTTPKGIRVYLESPFPADVSRVTGNTLETVYIWIGWNVGGCEVWHTW